MTSISELLRELVLIESRLGCYEILYRGMPLYRIFRFELRKKYLKKRVPNYTMIVERVVSLYLLCL